MNQARRFARCIIIDDDPDVLLSARLLLRDLFDEVATFEKPEETREFPNGRAEILTVSGAELGRFDLPLTGAEVARGYPQVGTVLLGFDGGLNVGGR